MPITITDQITAIEAAVTANDPAALFAAAQALAQRLGDDPSARALVATLAAAALARGDQSPMHPPSPLTICA